MPTTASRCSASTMARRLTPWATAARVSNIPISVISEGLGHDSEETTQIYLASIENSVVDKANSRIIGLLD